MTALGTEFTHYFCAGIGPLQFGVVLVFFQFQNTKSDVISSDKILVFLPGMSGY